MRMSYQVAITLILVLQLLLCIRLAGDIAIGIAKSLRVTKEQSLLVAVLLFIIAFFLLEMVMATLLRSLRVL